MGAAYQRDGNGGKEWGVGASYTFAPVTLGASYADHKNAASTKTRIVNAYVSGDVTANDTVYFQYNRNQEKLRLTSKPLKMLMAWAICML